MREIGWKKICQPIFFFFFFELISRKNTYLHFYHDVIKLDYHNMIQFEKYCKKERSKKMKRKMRMKKLLSGMLVALMLVSSANISLLNVKAATQPEAPTNLTAEREDFSTVKLEWDAVEGTDVTYNVYRMDSKGMECIATGNVETFYVDKTALNTLGTIRYRVTSVIEGVESGMRAPVAAPTVNTTWGWIDDKDANIVYASTWHNYDLTAANYNGTIKYLESVDAVETSTVTLEFMGDGIEIYGCTSHDRGIFEVLIDGKSYGEVDTYSSSAKRQAKVFEVANLDCKKHILVIKPLGKHNASSSANKLELDAFRILDDFMHVYSATGITTIGKKNSSVQMKADIDVGHVADESVTWTSSDDTIATVDENGLVTVNDKNGSVTITATLNADTTVTSSVDVIVKVAPIMEEVTVDLTKESATTVSGGWYNYGDSACYGGGKLEVSGAGAYIEYKFSGTGIDVYAVKGWNMAAFDIYIDNVLAADDISLDGNAGSIPQSLIFSKTDLKNKEHTIKIEVVDRVHKDGVVKTKAALDFVKIHKPTEAITTETVVDDYVESTDTWNFKFSSGWKYKDAGKCYGDWKSESSTVGAYLEYSFFGTGVEVYSHAKWKNGCFDVYIDNVLVGDNVNLYPATAYQKLVFSKKDLTREQHTIKLVVVERLHSDGSTQKEANVDFLKIFDTEPVYYADKAELQDIIAECKSLVNEGYTEESWLNLSEAIAAAVVVMNDGKANDADVAVAVENLNSAKNGLVIAPPEQPEPPTPPATPLVKHYADIAEYRNGEAYSYPAIDGVVFAGWYTDEECTNPLEEDVVEGEAYAKYVNADTLSAKAQVTAGTTAASEKADIRFISTVDTLDYQKVGFYITIEGRELQTVSSTTAYERLYANREGEIDTITPGIFSKDSTFFFTYAYWNVPNKNFDTNFEVTPYWVTHDGTVVVGTTLNRTIREHC